MLVSGGWLKSCVSKFWVAQNCARKFRVTILSRDPLTIPGHNSGQHHAAGGLRGGVHNIPQSPAGGGSHVRQEQARQGGRARQHQQGTDIKWHLNLIILNNTTPIFGPPKAMNVNPGEPFENANHDAIYDGSPRVLW